MTLPLSVYTDKLGLGSFRFSPFETLPVFIYTHSAKWL